MVVRGAFADASSWARAFAFSARGAQAAVAAASG